MKLPLQHWAENITVFLQRRTNYNHMKNLANYSELQSISILPSAAKHNFMDPDECRGP